MPCVGHFYVGIMMFISNKIEQEGDSPNLDGGFVTKISGSDLALHTQKY